MKLKAYAKLNLALDIIGQYPNGMHELDMLMQNISLADELTVVRADGLALLCDGMEAQGDNTVLRAARLFFEKTGITGGAKITLEKRIPSQAGLGGGSSDAAATLAALDRIYETHLSKKVLKEIGVGIGADVPFFIEGGCMRARGVGEVLSPAENRCGFAYLLVKPEGGVPTGQAYGVFHELPKETVDMDGIADALAKGDVRRYFSLANNALMPAGIRICPEVSDVICACRALGADFAMMTGSGSCVFAIFPEEALQGAQAVLDKRYPFCVAAEERGAGYEIIRE